MVSALSIHCTSASVPEPPAASIAYEVSTLERERAIAQVATFIFESKQEEYLARLAAGLFAIGPRRPNTLDWQVREFGEDSLKVYTKYDGVWLVNENGGNPSYLEPSPISTPAMSLSSTSFPTPSPTPTPRPRPTPTPYPANTFPLGGLYDDPPQIVIGQGTIVTWINNSQSPQSIDSCAQKYCLDFSGAWASGEILPGGSYSLTFNQTGTFYYRKNESLTTASFILVTAHTGAQSAQGGNQSTAASSTTQGADTGCPSGFPEYQHPQGKWSICLPTTWTIDPVPGEEAWDMYGGTPQFKDGRGVAVSELANYGPEDLEAVTDFLVQATEDKSVELEVISYDSYDWYGYDAYILELTTTNAIGQPMRRFLMTVAAKGNVYSLEVFCPSYLWSLHENTMVTIVDYFLVA